MSDVLVSQEAEVICVDNLASGLKSNVDHLLHLDNCSFIEHDITEPFFVEGKLDLVVHMASRASPFEFEHYPLEILKANTIAVSYTHLRAHETVLDLVCRLLLEKKKTNKKKTTHQNNSKDNTTTTSH